MRIRAVHAEGNTYGAPRITELNDGTPAGERVNHKRVARVMRVLGIAGYRRPRRVRTTVPDPAAQKVLDLLGRNFTAAMPNRKYVGGWLGGRSPNHMRTDLVTDALNTAHTLRGSLAGAVFHTDHGSRYTSEDFAVLCTELGVIQLMGSVGTSADNSLAESFNAALEHEVLQDDTCWPDGDICRREVFRWLARYNTKRRHSYCRNVSPTNFERTRLLPGNDAPTRLTPSFAKSPKWSIRCAAEPPRPTADAAAAKPIRNGSTGAGCCAPPNA